MIIEYPLPVETKPALNPIKESVDQLNKTEEPTIIYKP
jgi:hypothetical protein